MAEDQRPPVFELHIRPMFRLLDREHMSKWDPAFDLWDLDAVWTMRNEILTRVRDVGDMPGDRYGGPWAAPEWIALFERWVATGSDTEPGHHLVVVRPDGECPCQGRIAEAATDRQSDRADRGVPGVVREQRHRPGHARVRAPSGTRVPVTARRSDPAASAGGLREGGSHHARDPRRGRPARAGDPIAPGSSRRSGSASVDEQAVSRLEDGLVRGRGDATRARARGCGGWLKRRRPRVHACFRPGSGRLHRRLTRRRPRVDP